MPAAIKDSAFTVGAFTYTGGGQASSDSGDSPLPPAAGPMYLWSLTPKPGRGAHSVFN